MVNDNDTGKMLLIIKRKYIIRKLENKNQIQIFAIYICTCSCIVFSSFSCMPISQSFEVPLILSVRCPKRDSTASFLGDTPVLFLTPMFLESEWIVFTQDAP